MGAVDFAVVELGGPFIDGGGRGGSGGPGVGVDIVDMEGGSIVFGAVDFTVV